MVDSFGDKIKEIRKEKGLSVREAAKRANISHPYLSQLENRKRGVPTIQVIAQLARGLNTDKDILLYEAGYISEEDKRVMEDSVNILKDLARHGGEVVTPKDLQKKIEDVQPFLLEEILSDESLVQYHGEYLTNEEKKEMLNYVDYLVNKKTK